MMKDRASTRPSKIRTSSSESWLQTRYSSAKQLVESNQHAQQFYFTTLPTEPSGRWQGGIYFFGCCDLMIGGSTCWPRVTPMINGCRVMCLFADVANLYKRTSVNVVVACFSFFGFQDRYRKHEPLLIDSRETAHKCANQRETHANCLSKNRH